MSSPGELAKRFPFHIAYPYIRNNVWDGDLIARAIEDDIDPEMLKAL